MPLISGSTTGANVQYTRTGEIFRTDGTSLYSFTTITFNNCGATGRTGPTLAQMQSTYSAYSWASNTTYLNNVSGIHKWTVPITGYYRITAAGAPGGGGSDWFSGTGSYDSSGNQGKPSAGIIVSGNFWLTSGDILYILVGQKGIDNNTNQPGGFYSGTGSDTDGGGGGGTFVAKRVTDSTQSNYYFTPDTCYVQPVIIAGGGGGGSSDGNAANAVFVSNQLTQNWAALDQWGYSTGGGWNKYPGDEVYSGLSARVAAGLTGTGNGSTAGGQTNPPGRYLDFISYKAELVVILDILVIRAAHFMAMAVLAEAVAQQTKAVPVVEAGSAESTETTAALPHSHHRVVLHL